MRDNLAEIFFQSFLLEALMSSSCMGRDLHCLMLPIQHFLCWPWCCPPSKVPWRIVLERLSWCVTCWNHVSFRLLTVARRGSCRPTRKLILLCTQSLVLCNTFSFPSKFKPYKSLVTSILLYGCEIWTLLADSEKKKIDPGFWSQVHEENLHALSHIGFWRLSVITKVFGIMSCGKVHGIVFRRFMPDQKNIWNTQFPSVEFGKSLMLYQDRGVRISLWEKKCMVPPGV